MKDEELAGRFEEIRMESQRLTEMAEAATEELEHIERKLLKANPGTSVRVPMRGGDLVFGKMKGEWCIYIEEPKKGKSRFNECSRRQRILAARASGILIDRILMKLRNILQQVQEEPVL